MSAAHRLAMLERTRDLALAEARHAWDYGTREGFERAQHVARQAEQSLRDERERAALLRVAKRYSPGISEPEIQRHVDAAIEGLAMVPAGWPDYGPNGRWEVQS